MKPILLVLLIAGGLRAQVVVINSSDNGAVSLGKINANFALLAPKANPIFTGAFTFTGLGTGALKSTSGVLGLISGTSTHCVHVDGSAAACTTGAVVSVAMTGDNVIYNTSVTGSPVTNTGTLVPSLKTQTANFVLAGPTTGAAATPTFRAMVAADFPAVATFCPTCIVASSPGAGVLHVAGGTQTATSSAVVNADITSLDASTKLTGATPTANMAAAALVRPCEIVIGDPGAASAALANDNDTPAVCVNDSSQTMTITAVKCYADAGSPTVTPIITGGGGTSILSGALTCGNGSYASGTLNGTPTETAGQTIDGNITAAGGTAKYIVIRISRTL